MAPSRPPRAAALAALLAAGSLLGCGTRKAGTLADGPNFVVVSVDTFNRGELRAFDPGAQALPHLDRFADRALRFSQAFSTASWTLPAQTSILTGLYPHHHRAVHPDVGLGSEIPTLAESLDRAGYRTVAFTHGGFVHRRYGLDRGFDLYDDWRNSPDLLDLKLPRHGGSTELSGPEIFDRAIAFLEARRPGDPPFFLFAHTYNVHDYYRVNPWIRGPGGADVPPDPDGYTDCVKGRRECSEDEWDRLRRYYDAEIRHFDEAFGLLLEALAANAAEPTYIVLVSDHGEGFAPERNRIYHVGRLHDDLIRVPLLLAGPGIEPAATARPVSIVDIAPTLLELAGAATPSQLDGRSLLATDSPAPGEPRYLFACEYGGGWPGGVLQWLEAPLSRPLVLAAVADGMRLIVDRGSRKLYFMPGDPWQAHDISAERADVVDSLLAAASPILRTELEFELVERDSDLDRKLRALGYL